LRSVISTRRIKSVANGTG